MEGLLGLLAVVTFLIALYGIGRVNTVAQRLDELREEVEELRRRLRSAAAAAAPVVSARPSPAITSAAPAAPAASEAPSAANAVTATARAADRPIVPPVPAPIPAPQVIATQVESASLEERLGARLPVWLGSVALTLAGAFLVKYTFDRGLLSPSVRVILGLAFGAVLLVAGEWMRRSNVRIAQGLSAAGIAVLYACFLAATNLYHLVSPATGFLFIALNTAGAVTLALRQGVIVAAVGMIGGFLTPLFLGSEEPRPQTLFAYFLLLQCGLLAVSRRRGWPAVPLASFAAGLFWVMGWLAGPFREGHAVTLGAFLLTSIAVAVGGTLGAGSQEEESSPTPRVAACVGGFVAMAALLMKVGYAAEEWVFVGLLSIGVLVLARIDARLEGMVWIPPAAAALLFLFWLTDLTPADAARFLWTLAGFAALFGFGGYAFLFGARRPAWWASVSAGFGVFALLAGYAGWQSLDRSFPWGATAVTGAVAYALLAWPLLRRRDRLGDAPLSAICVGASSCLSLAVPFELERQWLAVGWAVEVLALVALAGRLRVAALRPMALLLAAAVSWRLLLNVFVLDYPIGSLPILNWLLYGYGVPLVAFAGAAVVASRSRDDELRTPLAWLAICFALALVTLEARQALHPGNLAVGTVDFREWGLYIAVWLALGSALWQAAPRWPVLVPERSGVLILGGALGAALVGPGLLANPLIRPSWVGATPVLNHVAWVLGLPVAAGLWLWRVAPGRDRPKLAGAAAAVSLLLSFLLVTLEVRQLFHGGFLDRGPTSGAERYAYSAAWILFGTLLLVLGIARQSKPIRFAALGVMLLAVLKVFLYDMSALRDLYRVFSFLGMGASLLLLAWLYQRFVFREPPAGDEAV